MEEQKEILAYRDIQEIRITLKIFTEDVLNQLKLLREALNATASQEKCSDKNINALSSTIRNLEEKFIYYNKHLDEMTETIELLEEKIIDKNNNDSIIVNIKNISEELEELKKSIASIDRSSLTLEEKRTVKDALEKITSATSEMKDKKKNLDWWSNWIYRILLIITLLYNFLPNVK